MFQWRLKEVLTKFAGLYISDHLCHCLGTRNCVTYLFQYVILKLSMFLKKIWCYLRANNGNKGKKMNSQSVEIPVWNKKGLNFGHNRYRGSLFRSRKMFKVSRWQWIESIGYLVGSQLLSYQAHMSSGPHLVNQTRKRVRYSG